jgi:hypothetical protein
MYETECILRSSTQRSRNFNPVSEIRVADVSVLLQSTIETVGVTLHSHLTFNFYLIHAVNQVLLLTSQYLFVTFVLSLV